MLHCMTVTWIILQ